MRYLVIGTSGAGKSTFAQQLAAAVPCRHLELDALYWGANWQAVPNEQFVPAVAAASHSERWVADGNYSAVRHILWPRATHVIWLNYSRWTVFTRLLRRTFVVATTKAPLSHGNRESLRRAFCSRDSVLWWSMSTYAKNQSKYAALRASNAFAHLQWSEFTHPSQALTFLQQLQAPARP